VKALSSAHISAIQTVNTYINDVETHRRCVARASEEFDYVATLEFAAYDIIREIRSHPDMAPIEIVEDYKWNTEEIGLGCKKTDVRMMFIIMSETAEVIIDYLINTPA